MSRKLIICGSCLQSGGAERVLSVLSTPFSDHFDEVIMILWLDWRFPGQFYSVDERVKVIGIGEVTGSHSVLKHMIWFRKFVKEQRPNLILTFFEMINLCVIAALTGLKNKIIVSERNDPHFFQHSIFFRKIINLAYRSSSVKKVVMQTQHNKEYFKNSSVYVKVEVIFNPINISKDILGAGVNSSKKKIVLSAARLEPQKKQEVLISAFAEFHKSHQDYMLVIYGNGSCYKRLVEHSRALGIETSIMMPGSIKNLWDEMKTAKMFVMTSEFEGMSNSLIEAMAIGLPCISTKVSGATDLINNANNGFLVDQGDVAEIAKSMSLIADDDQVAYNIGMEASKVYSLLNIDIISSKWISLFDSVINN